MNREEERGRVHIQWIEIERRVRGRLQKRLAIKR